LLGEIEETGAKEPRHLLVGAADVHDAYEGAGSEIVVDEVIHEEGFSASRRGCDENVMVVGVPVENVQGTGLPLSPDEDETRLASAREVRLDGEGHRYAVTGRDKVPVEVVHVVVPVIEAEGKGREKEDGQDPPVLLHDVALRFPHPLGPHDRFTHGLFAVPPDPEDRDHPHERGPLFHLVHRGHVLVFLSHEGRSEASNPLLLQNEVALRVELRLEIVKYDVQREEKRRRDLVGVGDHSPHAPEELVRLERVHFLGIVFYRGAAEIPVPYLHSVHGFFDDRIGEDHLFPDRNRIVVGVVIRGRNVIQVSAHPVDERIGMHGPGIEVRPPQDFQYGVGEILRVELHLPFFGELHRHEEAEISQRGLEKDIHALHALLKESGELLGGLVNDREVARFPRPVRLDVGIDIAVRMKNELHDGSMREPQSEEPFQGEEGLFPGEAERAAFPEEALGAVRVLVCFRFAVIGDPGEIIGKPVPAGQVPEIFTGHSPTGAEDQVEEPSHQSAAPSFR